jgi:carbonic anhydrase/acetyltransferase-like protein (isoleucine patch superfamily)
LTLGNDVTVGHRATLHGCTVGDGSLIGIGAIVLNGACLGRGCLVGAGAVVTEGKTFPDFSMVVGTPAKLVKQLSQEQVESLMKNAAHYVANSRRFRAELTLVEG